MMTAGIVDVTVVGMPTTRLLTSAFRLLTAVLAILITVPATAAAAKRPTRATAPVALARSIAERYWNAVPCGGQIKVLVDQPVPALLKHDSDAWVTFGSSLGENNLAAPA